MSMSREELEVLDSAQAAALSSAWPDGSSEPAMEKEVQIDAAYDEYRRLRDQGAEPDPDAFCRDFPFQSSLRRLLEADRFLRENPQLLESLESAPPAWPKPGAFFLGFLLQRELGRGAFARVFLAREPALGNRRVAVKIALHGGAEAETLGRLEHRNIVAVHSIKKDDATGLTAVCMPYLGGTNLCHLLDLVGAVGARPRTAEVIQRAIDESRPADEAAVPPSWTRRESYVGAVTRIGAQLADGLASIHAQGICHRDLKPSNVLLAADGRAMLLDFNLSFDAQASEQRLGGTLPYMSPEQLRATDSTQTPDPAAVNARSDLFSLGVLLYELLAGAHPFGPVSLKWSMDEVRAHLCKRHVEGPRPLREVNPRVGRTLARLIEGCLAADPAQRPKTAAELAKALRRARPVADRARRWVAGNKRALAASVVLVFAAGVTAAAVKPESQASLMQKARKAYETQNYEQTAGYCRQILETKPKDGEALYLGGRSYQRLGDDATADNLYVAALDVVPEEWHGKIEACRAYCQQRQSQPAAAALLFQKAIELGYETDRVYNDLGYTYTRRRNEETAQAKGLEALGNAIRLNSNLQAAYYNRAILLNDRIGQTQANNPIHPLTDIDHAIFVGQKTPTLYFDASRLYAEASTVRPRAGATVFDSVRNYLTVRDQGVTYQYRAIEYAQSALALGYQRKLLERDFVLGPLAKQIPPVEQLSPVPDVELRLLDPVED
jgi:serine/threonine protein kinase